MRPSYDRAKLILGGLVEPERTFTPEERLLCAVLARALADALSSPSYRTGDPYYDQSCWLSLRNEARRFLQFWPSVSTQKDEPGLTIRFILESLVEDAEGAHREILRVLSGERKNFSLPGAFAGGRKKKGA